MKIYTLHTNRDEIKLSLKSALHIFNSICPFRSWRRYEHSVRVGLYAASIGRGLKLNEKQIIQLQIAGIFHDIGFIGINDTILEKKTPLSQDEILSIKKHPYTAIKILDYMKLSDYIIKGVLQHHECYNGKGYPSGLKGDQISLQGRILFLAEVFDAMTNNAPYRKAEPIDSVIDFIKRMKGSIFDPTIVDVTLGLEEFSSIYSCKDSIPEYPIYKNIIQDLNR
ncbi:MAG: HD domain-containing protein [Deltaproteobacteria bacterium]|nr:HD domain-containing protein [Deltaproteobacteria bacterium]MCL5791901.1 HD domain-containing protein [Deltaproteobacteria bacterium]